MAARGHLNAEHDDRATGLATFQSAHFTDWPVLMAGTLMSQLPVLFLFVIGQRYFVSSIATTGLVSGPLVIADDVRQGWCMTKRARMWVWGAAIAVVVVGMIAAGVVIGRTTAPAHDPGFAQGNAAGYAEGVAAGRSLADRRHRAERVEKDVANTAFQAGYRAGDADAGFGAYDGGWKLGAPYVVILGKGVAGAAYRFVERDEVTPGTTYQLCPDGASLCHS